MKRFIVAGIGELLWDVLDDSEELGGAPVNFCFHANSLGAEGYPVSAVGNDQRGRAALATLAERRMSTDYIAVLEQAATGYVRASLDENGVASYEFPDGVAWDKLAMDKRTLSLAERVDAVCFGSLGQRSDRSRGAITSFLWATRPGALKIFDLNIRQQFYTDEIIRNSMKRANILKLNDDELHLLKAMEGLTGDETAAMQDLVKNYGLRLSILTRGGKGSLLVSSTEISEHPGYPAEVVDTIGAGDSFTAAVALGLLNGSSLPAINDRANRIAAFVCSRKGAMPSLPADLLAADAGGGDSAKQ